MSDIGANADWIFKANEFHRRKHPEAIFSLVTFLKLVAARHSGRSSQVKSSFRLPGESRLGRSRRT